jgi:hypothetical protein
MSMTKKEFKLLAELLAYIQHLSFKYKRTSNDGQRLKQKIIEVCKKSNPRFDEDKFMAYVQEEIKRGLKN